MQKSVSVQLYQQTFTVLLLVYLFFTEHNTLYYKRSFFAGTSLHYFLWIYKQWNEVHTRDQH